MKQVVAVYSNLDLSQVSIDDIVLLTLGGNDVVRDETNDSAHTIEEEVMDPNAEVVIQLALEGPAVLVVLFAADGPPTTNDPVSNAPLS